MIVVGNIIVVTKGSRGSVSGYGRVDKGTRARVYSIKLLGRDYGHKARVDVQFLNGQRAGACASFVVHHANRLGDKIVRLRNPWGQHPIEVRKEIVTS